MTKARKAVLIVIALLVVIAALAYWMSRGQTATQSVDAVSGVDPVLVEPRPERIPTVRIASPIGWREGEAPTPAFGLVVSRFAEGLDHPRVIYTLPNGDVLATLARAPASAGEADAGLLARLRQSVEGYFRRRSGADGVSANQLVLLRDADGDGRADARVVLTDRLDSPSGIAWHAGTLFVANHDAVLAYSFQPGETRLSGEPRRIMSLPAGGGHWMRNLVVDPDGEALFVAVGSASNIGERGMEAEEGRAAIWRYDLRTGRQAPFAAGLRNPNGLAFSPWSGDLWTTVNERDLLGPDLVPDYLTDVPVGAQYGWPWLYWRNTVDRRVKAPMPQFLIEYTRRPRYALGPHVAALGLVFAQEGHRIGPAFGSGAIIARHGSWNRRPPSGYDVVYVDFDARGNPQGLPIPLLTGFLTQDGSTRGRPTWVAWAKDGALLVSDDTAGIIWRVIAPDAAPAPAIARLTGARLPARAELRDPRDVAEENFVREQGLLR
uniref:PQQ-dependent sugar dehydrogenase n=1 Tax=Qipengyuania thermophila TaxID=2509361 RepID=UPI0010217F43|nr:PQQ-dependent sugar dehydrogenase [Qipengyuania thermophila]TCD06701.1 sorbosone dehydrogenase family protein [Erythrobacteraceae bacterium CFH 75059]